MRIGSLFSGYGGLDLAATALFPGAQIWWHCEWDDAPAKILAHHHPGVPNYRDVTQIDWEQLPAIDVLTGGYPCQPFSAAGRRKGTTDERHLWPYVRQAIRVLRPRYTLLENVAGHRSLGFDRVLGDLAEDGLHVRWTSIRASDIGAAHHRERLFILVTAPDAGGDGCARYEKRNSGPLEPGLEAPHGDDVDGRLLPTPTCRDHKGPNQRRDDRCLTGALLPTPTTQDAANLGAPSQHLRHSPPLNAVVLPTPRASDGEKGGPNQRGSSGDFMLPSAVAHLPTPKASDGKRNDCPAERKRNTPSLVSIEAYLPSPTASDATGGGQHPDRREGHTRQLVDYALLEPERWGQYAQAIRRHELRTRPAPPPTELGRNGNPRLSARFVEWLMMLPDGWVTDPALGLSRNQQLKALGNGVVPPQAAAAYLELLNWRVAA